jgi:hypothetical protein
LCASSARLIGDGGGTSAPVLSKGSQMDQAGRKKALITAALLLAFAVFVFLYTILSRL